MVTGDGRGVGDESYCTQNCQPHRASLGGFDGHQTVVAWLGRLRSLPAPVLRASSCLHISLGKIGKNKGKIGGGRGKSGEMTKKKKKINTPHNLVCLCPYIIFDEFLHLFPHLVPLIPPFFQSTAFSCFLSHFADVCNPSLVF